MGSDVMTRPSKKNADGPAAPASEFRQGPSLHSLALRARGLHFLAGLDPESLNPMPAQSDEFNQHRYREAACAVATGSVVSGCGC
jgi:hypothetical protein